MSALKYIRGTLLVCLLLGLSWTYVRASDECKTSAQDKELFTAIERREIKGLAALLEEKRVNINALGPVTGNWYDPATTSCATPLMYAAWLGDVQSVKLLLTNKARVNLRDGWDRTIWAYAISPHAVFHFPDRGREAIDERLEITKLLLAAGAAPNQADKGNSRETALFHAAHSAVLTGDLRILDALIAAGAEVNIKDNSILAFTIIMIQRALITKGRDADTAEEKAPGATNVLKALMAAGAQVDGRLDGKTALVYAARGARLAGTLERIKLLIAAGADVNAQHGESGQTPLLSALKTYDSWLMSIGFQRDPAIELHDQVEVVNVLLTSGANPNKRDKAEDTAIHATFHTYTMYRLANYPAEAEKLFRVLIAARADLNAKDAKGQTIIHLLTNTEGFRPEYFKHGDEVMLQLLRLFASAKADFNVFDNDKTTPLLGAVKNKLKPEVVRALLAGGANPDLKNNLGRTPLMEAVVANTFEDDTVKALLAARPAINAQDNEGATALLLACIIGRRPSLVSFLIAAHADVNLPDKTGQTPLLAAAAFENRHGSFGAESADIVRQLINAGADIKARNAANETALMLAIRAEREDLIKLLLDAGVDLHAINSDGDSALTIAARMHGSDRRRYFYHNRPESLVERLIKAGARVRTRNKAGESVLTLISAKARPDEVPIIQLIVERAAREGREPFVQVEDLLGAIRRAGGKSSAATVKALIASGGDVKGRSEEGKAMLIVAVEESGNAEVVASLLAAGADVNVKDTNGDTPLIAAIRQFLGAENARVRRVLRQDPRVIEVLLSFRANPLDRTRDGVTALDLARQSGNEKLISLIQSAQP